MSGEIGGIFKAVCLRSIEAACSDLWERGPEAAAWHRTEVSQLSLFLPTLAAPSPGRESTAAPWLSGHMCGHSGPAECDGASQAHDGAGMLVPILVNHSRSPRVPYPRPLWHQQQFYDVCWVFLCGWHCAGGSTLNLVSSVHSGSPALGLTFLMLREA